MMQGQASGGMPSHALTSFLGFWLRFCGAATLSERISSRLTNPDGENEPRVSLLPRLQTSC